MKLLDWYAEIGQEKFGWPEWTLEDELRRRCAPYHTSERTEWCIESWYAKPKAWRLLYRCGDHEARCIIRDWTRNKLREQGIDIGRGYGLEGGPQYGAWRTNDEVLGRDGQWHEITDDKAFGGWWKTEDEALMAAGEAT